MGQFPDFLGYAISALSMVLLGVGFIMLLRTIRKSNRVRASSLVLSTIFSIAMLLLNLVMMKQAKVQWWFPLLLLFGTGFGFAWGTTTMLSFKEQKIMGKRSVLYVYFWLISMLTTQVLALFARTNVVAYGLAGMFFSTGASLGTNGNLLVRMRQLLRSPAKVTAEEEPAIAEKTTAVGFCMQCGAALEAGAAFCPQCGKAVGSKKKKRSGKRIWVAGVAVAAVAVLAASGYYLLQALKGIQPAPANNPMSAAEPVTSETLVAQAQETLNAQPSMLNPTDTIQPVGADGGDAPASNGKTGIAQSGDFLSVSFDSVTGALLTPAFSEEYMRYYQAEGMGVIEYAGSSGLLPVLAMDTQYGNFTTFFDFMMPEAYDDSSCGLIFRSKGTITEGLQEFYALFLYPGKNELKMGIWVDNGWVYSEVLSPDPPMYTGYDANTVQVDVSGDSIRISINDSFVGDFSEGTLAEPGFIGLFLYPWWEIPEGGNDYVLFDNLLVVEE